MIAPSASCWSLRTAAQVPEEVHCAALPRGAEHLRQRGLQSGMRVADGQLHADQAARDEAAEEFAPEHLGFGFADVQADDLAAAGLVHGCAITTHLRATRPPARTFSTLATTNRYG